MTLRPTTFAALAALTPLTAACVIDMSDEDGSHAERIQINADRAVEACGADNVGSVDAEGYTCEAGASARD